MLRYIAIAVLLTPLLGIWLMEGGAYGPSIGAYGAPNGATLAYAVYAATVVATAWLVARCMPVKHAIPPLPLPLRDREFRRAAVAVLIINVVFLGVLLFGAGGYRVLLGQVSKGEFRTTLGGIGALAYLLQRNLIPGLCALVAALYMGSSRRPAQRRWLAVNLLVVFAGGLTWGFKSTPLTMLLPTLVLLFWRITWTQLVVLGATAFGVLVTLFQFFDADVEVAASALDFVWRRLTVIQGDVAWKIWDAYVAGEVFPDYWRTLLAVMGDRLMEILLGLDRIDYVNWVQYHYDLLLTSLAGFSFDIIEGGHSVTATPFAEGVIALGSSGVVVYGLIGGALLGLFYSLIRKGLAQGRPLMAAIAATYACTAVIPWLNAGAIVQLAHVSTLAGILMLVVAMRMIRRTRIVWSRAHLQAMLHVRASPAVR
jgi:hypothetical protein